MPRIECALPRSLAAPATAKQPAGTWVPGQTPANRVSADGPRMRTLTLGPWGGGYDYNYGYTIADDSYWIH